MNELHNHPASREDRKTLAIVGIVSLAIMIISTLAVVLYRAHNHWQIIAK